MKKMEERKDIKWNSKGGEEKRKEKNQMVKNCGSMKKDLTIGETKRKLKSQKEFLTS